MNGVLVGSGTNVNPARVCPGSFRHFRRTRFHAKPQNAPDPRKRALFGREAGNGTNNRPAIPGIGGNESERNPFSSKNPPIQRRFLAEKARGIGFSY